jgi:hypothetical protein
MMPDSRISNPVDPVDVDTNTLLPGERTNCVNGVPTSLADSWDDGAPILCPECGFEYCHLERVAVDQRGVVTSVARNGVRLRGPYRSTRRGSVVQVFCHCENGHRFLVQFSFHKGCTYVKSEGIGGDLDALHGVEELWRD